MKLKNLLQNIFLITNKDNKKILRILGITFTFNKSEKYQLEHIFCKFVNKFCKVNPNKIVIINMMNWQYACNPKYILEELLKRDDANKLDIVWIKLGHTDTSKFPKGIRFVQCNTLKAIYELLTSKVWIANAHMFWHSKRGVIKPKETIFIQTYHGSMGIKKIDADAKTFEDMGWAKWQKICAQSVNYIFTDSECEKNIFKTAFWGNGEILKLGKARDCIFYKDPTPYIEKVKEFYNIPKENKILLYAPTWRSDKRCNCYNIDIKALKKALKKRFGGDWSILIRAHIHMKKNIFNALYDENEVINASAYIDMQELLVAADVLISDYSSCVPEYTILKKPSFLYATDIEKYENGFYYPLTDLPSPLATDNYELINNVLNFDEKLFKQKAEQFLIDKGHQDDENSCVRIVDFILEKMNEKSK